MYGLQFPVLESGGKHLGIDLVHRRELFLFFEEEDGVRTAHGIEAAEGGSGVEVGHNFRGPYLVEEMGCFLGDDEGVAHEAGPVDAGGVHQHSYAVGGILAVAVVPDYGFDVEAGDAVQFAEAHGIAGDLYVGAEDFDVPDSHGETYAGGVRRRYRGYGISYVDGIRTRLGYGIQVCFLRQLHGIQRRHGRRICRAHPRRIRCCFPSRIRCWAGALFGRKLISRGGIALRSIFRGGGRFPSPAAKFRPVILAAPRQHRIRLRILFGSLPGSLGCSLHRLPAILGHGIAEYLFQTGLRLLYHALRNLALLHRVVNKFVGPDVDGIYLGALHRIRVHDLILRTQGHRSLFA